ncbi:MAG TPA: LysM peptidoglycan-binding domain-containing protein [Flavobacteriales bacterium]
MAQTRALLLLAALLPIGAFAQDPVPADDPVLEQLDKLSMLPWLKNDPFVTDAEALNVHGFRPEEVPTYTPDVYRRRLTTLDEISPCKLTYNNQVQGYIDMYSQRKREQTARMMGLAQLYFPVFEEALDRYNMPQELKYLAVVESALYPGAKSRAAAVGLWQFMIGTGKMYGLRSDSYVDERCDIYKSTDAACRYLRDLHRIFGSWELALAAYNCGPGNVNKAVRRAGGTLDYWAIYDHLPRETRGYVPAFIAVNYIFNHAADHNIYPVIPNYCAYEVDTVQVCHPLSLDQLATIIGGNAQEIRDLNPVYKLGVVPDMQQPATIYLPRDLVASFIRNEATIAYSYQPDLSLPAPGAATASADRKEATTGKPTKTHTVRRGESLGTIARKHGTSVQNLRKLNHLRHDRIAVGQKLVIRRGDPESAASTTAPATAEKEEAPDYIYHTIQKGDTLWGIAQRYPGASVDEIKRLNDAKDTRTLPIGKKLKVSVQKS